VLLQVHAPQFPGGSFVCSFAHTQLQASSALPLL
jgi:hypothetical protein